MTQSAVAIAVPGARCTIGHVRRGMRALQAIAAQRHEAGWIHKAPIDTALCAEKVTPIKPNVVTKSPWTEGI